MALINILMPHAKAIAVHPIYRVGILRQHRGCTLQRIIPYSLRIFLIVFLPLMLIWIGSVWQRFQDERGNPYMSGWATNNTSGGIIVWIVMSGLIGASLLDLSAMMASVHSINTERNLARWDLVRVSPLHPRSIIVVKHALAQMQSWRLVTIIISLRITALLLILAHMFLVPQGMPARTASQRLLDELSLIPVEVLVSLLAVFVLSVVFLLEPLWRVRAVTALGLLVSARVRNGALALLAGLFGVFLVWFGQFVLAILVLTGISVVFSWMTHSEALLIVVIALMIVTLSAVLYGWLRLLTVWSLRRTVVIAFRG